MMPFRDGMTLTWYYGERDRVPTVSPSQESADAFATLEHATEIAADIGRAQDEMLRDSPHWVGEREPRNPPPHVGSIDWPMLQEMMVACVKRWHPEVTIEWMKL